MNTFIFQFKAFFVLLLFGVLASCGGGDSGNGSAGSQAVYLQAVTTDSIYVMAESQSADPLSVNYGLTPAYGQSAVTASVKSTTGGTYIHRIPLTSLTPDTIYYYQVRTHSASFQTAAPAGASFRFAWMSDSQTNTTIHDKVATLIQAAAPRFSLYGGDLCFDGAIYNVYKDEFFRANQLALAARVPFFNSTGNHEKWGTNTKAFLQAPDSASGNQGYYSFDYGDLHIVVMNYMDPGGYSTGSPQYNFIVSDLAATTKPWKIVICHAPAYASSGRDEDAAMVALTTNVFEPRGVTLVISGHYHYYQRNLVNGIYHLIIASAGGALENPSPVGGYVQVSIRTYCYAIFDLTPTTLEMRAYNENGAEIDSLFLSR